MPPPFRGPSSRGRPADCLSKRGARQAAASRQPRAAGCRCRAPAVLPAGPGPGAARVRAVWGSGPKGNARDAYGGQSGRLGRPERATRAAELPAPSCCLLLRAFYRVCCKEQRSDSEPLLCRERRLLSEATAPLPSPEGTAGRRCSPASLPPGNEKLREIAWNGGNATGTQKWPRASCDRAARARALLSAIAVALGSC